MSDGAPLAAPTRDAITGLVLAGGRGARMGGQDKGLIDYRARPLVCWALDGLAPQVGTLAINANRHHARYAALASQWARECGAQHPDLAGAFIALVSDAQPTRYAGPLAGMLAGLQAMHTPWLATAPCDMPHLPAHWVAHLAGAVQWHGGSGAFCTEPLDSAGANALPGGRAWPVCALLHASMAAPIAEALAAGHHKVEWVLRRAGALGVALEGSAAWFNANTPADLAGPQDR